MVTRRVNVFDPAVVTMAKIEAGTTRNVIPETASLLGTIRTVSEATRERVLDGVRRVAEGVAAAHGAKVSVGPHRGYPVTVNDDDFAVASCSRGDGAARRRRTCSRCPRRSWAARTSRTCCSACPAPWPTSAPPRQRARRPEPLQPGCSTSPRSARAWPCTWPWRSTSSTGTAAPPSATVKRRPPLPLTWIRPVSLPSSA